LATLLAVAVGSGPALADTQVIDKGHTGRHRLVDTELRPGAECVYVVDDEMDLVSLAVRRPVVFARDRTAVRDQQWVGWRVVVRAWVWDWYMEGHWEVVAMSPIQQALAWDDTRAVFTSRTVPVTEYHEWFQARVQMLWYRPGVRDRVAGSAYHAVDRHAIEESTETWWRCPGHVW
jgi:hypothetical protein